MRALLQLLLLLLCGLLLSISVLRFSLPVPALVLLLISILLGTLVSALVSLLVLFWFLLRRLSIPLLLLFIFILMIRSLCVSQSASTENEQHNRFTRKFNRLHDFLLLRLPGRLVGGGVSKS